MAAAVTRGLLCGTAAPWRRYDFRLAGDAETLDVLFSKLKGLIEETALSDGTLLPVSAAPAQMLQGCTQSRCRCGQREPQSRWCRCGQERARSRCRVWEGRAPVPVVQMWSRASPVPMQMWEGRAPVPVQMWEERAPVPVQMWEERARSAPPGAELSALFS